jgi:hypothetical protein
MKSTRSGKLRLLCGAMIKISYRIAISHAPPLPGTALTVCHMSQQL